MFLDCLIYYTLLVKAVLRVLCLKISVIDQIDNKIVIYWPENQFWWIFLNFF